MTDIQKQIMSERDARVLTERIRLTAHNYTEARDKLIRYVQEAKDGNAHEALGYASWTAYLAETLGEEPMRLARDERQEMVKVLSAEGMSTRAIAPIVGVSHKTVVKDGQANRQVVPRVPPAPNSDAELISGAEWSPEAVEDEPRFTDEPGHVQPVTGMDGKTYTRPEPKEPQKPRAEAITSQFSSVIVDLNRVLDRFHRISNDTNFNRNKSQIETLHGNDLARAISELQDLANQLN